jgi:hypothetical protein
MTHQLPIALQRYIDAVNGFDTEAVLATFTPDALVYDDNHEYLGTDAIRGFLAGQIVGVRVTMAVTEVIERRGVTVVRARYDGDYDKTGLPEELILTNYAVLDGELISELFIVFNKD